MGRLTWVRRCVRLLVDLKLEHCALAACWSPCSSKGARERQSLYVVACGTQQRVGRCSPDDRRDASSESGCSRPRALSYDSITCSAPLPLHSTRGCGARRRAGGTPLTPVSRHRIASRAQCMSRAQCACRDDRVVRVMRACPLFKVGVLASAGHPCDTQFEANERQSRETETQKQTESQREGESRRQRERERQRHRDTERGRGSRGRGDSTATGRGHGALCH